MINPEKVTKYNMTRPKLEEFILFWVCAAGKNGRTAAKCLDKLLSISNRKRHPFKYIRGILKRWGIMGLESELLYAGIGCWQAKARTFKALAQSGLDLKTCTAEDLETIPGIGPKTARGFLLHSRPNQRLACLDIHLLRFLRDEGFDAPDVTPPPKKYRELEAAFLKLADDRGVTPAELDLAVWTEYSQYYKPKGRQDTTSP
jgi:hypothetical protein